MPGAPTLTVYTDYKSPYAYLANDLVHGLAASVPVNIVWRPYVLDVPQYLGSAVIGPDGSVVEANRNAHQWRRVRYMFMDCRREARRRGLTLRATQAIYDTRLAASGMLYAQRFGHAVFRAYHDTVFARFWQRDLDIEDPSAIAAILDQAGAEPGFQAEADALRQQVDAIARAAEADGVFGVPSFVLDGELFWGREHLPEIRERLARRKTGLAKDWPGERMKPGRD
jgi:2-hydroxychromene-2-carboxylate isomerase